MSVKKKGLTYASFVAVAMLSGLLGGCGSDSVVTPPAATPVAAAPATTATLLYTSDAHYGIKRTGAYIFSGYSSGLQVNSAMVAVMNTMPAVTLPSDPGVKAGTVIGSVDYVIQGGDIANRMQADPTGNGYALVQPAYDSWKQFESSFINALRFPTLLIPGNHDVSNAIGYYDYVGASGSKVLNNGSGGKTDGSVMAFIYNMFVRPNTYNTSSKAVAQASYTQTNYLANTLANQTKVYYSRDIAGVHFMFISMWPDLDAQDWMDADLARISATTPAVIVTHDEPVTEPKHQTDPGGPSVWSNKFENLLVDRSPTTSLSAVIGPPAIAASDTNAAQRMFVRFLKRHKNIVAYFHGNTNFNDLGTCDPTTGATSTGLGCYKGPDAAIDPVYLPTFRVDSPMKGTITGLDAGSPDMSKLSYHVISVDSVAQKMTVRECFWNTSPVTWGASATISLVPRTK